VDELYRYSVVRRQPPSGDDGVVLEAADQTVLEPRADSADLLSFDRLPFPEFLPLLLTFRESPPTRIQDMASLLETLGVAPGSNAAARREQLAEELRGQKVESVKKGMSGLIQAALGSRPKSDGELERLLSVAAALETLEEVITGERDADSWTAGLSRMVVRPRDPRPLVDGTSRAAVVDTRNATRRLVDIVESVVVLRGATEGDVSLDECLRQVGSTPLGQEVFSRLAEVSLESVIGNLEAEGRAISSSLGLERPSERGTVIWGPVAGIAGIAHNTRKS